VLGGAADLHAFGAEATGLARVNAADASLTRLARRSATASGLAAGLTAALGGLALWGVLVLAVAATGSGALGRVPLAVVTLTALAAFDAVSPLAGAALQIGHAHTSASRIAAVLDAPEPVRDPAVPRALPSGPVRIQLRDARVRYSTDGPLALDGRRPWRFGVAAIDADRRGCGVRGRRAGGTLWLRLLRAQGACHRLRRRSGAGISPLL
jgi:ABC-type transport system involved in cytochrome bd biosynthesis fused ATPase/permease subunit